jgi:GAF domain-containing protein
LLSFIVGESEMAGRIRAHPWAETELGPLEQWPDSLKTLVSVMLAANQQMYVVWGPGQLLLYNDRYIEVLRGHHRDALGRPFLEVWSEIVDDLRPLVEKAYAGIPTYQDDIFLILERNGYSEETHFAYSYTPVFNARGTVDGFFCPCIETTEQVRAAAFIRDNEERQAFLLKFSDALRPLDAPDTVMDTATGLLRASLGASRCAYYEIDGDDYVLRGNSVEGVPQLVGRYAASSFGSALFDRHLGGHSPIVVDDVATAHGPTERDAFAAIQVGAYIGVILHKQGRFVAGLTVQSQTPRAWSAAEVAIVEETAERTLAAVERARAETALRQSEERQTYLLKLNDALRPLVDSEAIQHEAMRLLGERLGVSRAQYYTADETGEYLSSSGGYTDGVPAAIGRFRLIEFGNYAYDGFRAGETQVVSDARTDPRISASVLKSYETVGFLAYIGVPFVQRGRFLGTIAVHQSGPRVWTESEKILVEETAERAGVAVEQARAELALRQNEERHAFLLKLSDALRAETNPDSVGHVATAMIAERLGAERVYLVMLTPGDDNITVTHEARSKEMPPLKGAYRGSDFPSALKELFVHTIVYNDVRTDARLSEPERTAFAGLGAVGFMASPIRSGDKGVIWAAGAVSITPRAWTPSEITLFEESIERTWAAVERAHAESHQQVLLAELQHRVRNTLAVIRSITRRTAENTADKDEMLMHLSGRIDSFARVQAAVTRDPTNSVDLAMLIAEELRVAGAMEGPRLSISGPPVGLAPKAAETLGLAIHELTTNAIKYGALTSPQGRVAVKWGILQGGTGETLSFTWSEHAVGGLTEQPVRKGLGTEILTRTVPYELKATSELNFGPDGIVFAMTAPLGQLRR